MKRILSAFAVTAAVAAFADPSIDQLVVRQEWPWKTDVKVDFDLTGATVEAPVDVFAHFSSADGTVSVEGAAATNGDASVTAGLVGLETGGHLGLSFDPVKAFPERKQVPEFRVALDALTAEQAKYLVFDLSAGPAAASYPYFLTNEMSAAVLAGDACRTTQLWLRRIPGGAYKMGTTAAIAGVANENWDNSNYNIKFRRYDITLSHDFYIGVFELTQKQCALICGNTYGTAAGGGVGDTLPANNLNYNVLRSNINMTSGVTSYLWPSNAVVNEASVLGKLRVRTGFPGFDLPTSAQWERAARAGGTDYCGVYPDINATALDDPQLTAVAVVSAASMARVGSKNPNAWGLYDVLGNAYEIVIDSYRAYDADYRKHQDVMSGTDPVGDLTYEAQRLNMRRGGAYSTAAADFKMVSLYYRNYTTSNGASGARLCVNLVPYLKK